MDRGQVLDLTKNFATAVRGEFPAREVLLFGSWARGDADDDSDIDVAVIVDRIDGNWLDAASRLVELGWQFDSRIEPVLLEATGGRSGFLESIRQYGIAFHG